MYSTARRPSFGLAFALMFLMVSHGTALAAILPVGNEQDAWSDMAFPTGVSGSYNAGTKALTLTGSPSNDLEIGVEFGPSNVGKHYGTGGTLGGPFNATLNLTGVAVQSDGSVTAGGTVSVVLNGSAAGSIGDDYGIPVASPLLLGTVLEVLLDATGDNTLDILLSITGGALQNDNPDPDVGVFAPNGRGVLRIAGVTLPSDWSGNFSLNGATIDFLGIPEPGTLTLGILAGVIACAARRKR
jgi:hypothetical protein